MTGGGSGIGKGMSLLLAQKKANITIADLNLKGAEQVAEEIRKQGGKAIAVHCNVANDQSVQKAIKVAKESFGEVNILVNNAGIVSGKRLEDLDLKSIKLTLDVNVLAHFITTKAVLGNMIKEDKGHIVSISSAGGLAGVGKQTDYSASKFAAFGFNESLRVELKTLNSKIRTTVICPYYINTGMFEGSKTTNFWSIIFPVLDEKRTCKRIVNAILQNEDQVVMPFFINTSFFLRAFLPVFAFDYCLKLFGISDSMKDFIGRTKPAPQETPKK